MDLSSLMPSGFTLCGHQITSECLTIGLIATGSVGTCPQCHSTSTRVHSFYQRTLGDVPISGRRVRFLVRLRKFSVLRPLAPVKYLRNVAPQSLGPTADAANEPNSTSKPSGYTRALNPESVCVS